MRSCVCEEDKEDKEDKDGILDDVVVVTDGSNVVQDDNVDDDDEMRDGLIPIRKAPPKADTGWVHRETVPTTANNMIGPKLRRVEWQVETDFVVFVVLFSTAVAAILEADKEEEVIFMMVFPVTCHLSSLVVVVDDDVARFCRCRLSVVKLSSLWMMAIHYMTLRRAGSKAEVALDASSCCLTVLRTCSSVHLSIGMLSRSVPKTEKSVTSLAQTRKRRRSQKGENIRGDENAV